MSRASLKYLQSLRITKHPSRKVMNFRHLLSCDTIETNKQPLRFNFGEDLSYFVILRYKLSDFIKIFS